MENKKKKIEVELQIVKSELSWLCYDWQTYLMKLLNHESVYLQLQFCNQSSFIKPFDTTKLNFKRLKITKKVITKVYISGNCYSISNDTVVFQLCTNFKFLLLFSILQAFMY